MIRTAGTTLGLCALIAALSLTGCAAAEDDAAPETSADIAVGIPTDVPTAAVAPASPSPTPTHPADPRDIQYDADVAAWADPIPPGFVWPASITDLPAGRWHGEGDWSGYLTAAGIHHCMLVYAAWDAYFVDDDATASTEYAARADATMPEQTSPTRVTRDDGTVEDQGLASESGICNGFVGDLRQ